MAVIVWMKTDRGISRCFFASVVNKKKDLEINALASLWMMLLMMMCH